VEFFLKKITMYTLNKKFFLWSGPDSKTSSKIGDPHLRFVHNSTKADTGCFPEKTSWPTVKNITVISKKTGAISPILYITSIRRGFQNTACSYYATRTTSTLLFNSSAKRLKPCSAFFRCYKSCIKV